MKKRLLFFLVMCLACCFATTASAQKYALKTNLLYWATTTPNLAFEFGVGPKSTLEFQGAYNPFQFSGNKKIKHWLAMGEYRYWFCERFNGHLIGAHLFYSQYNMGGVKLDWLFGSGSKDHRYEGNMYGIGVSYGYNLMLSKHWNVEFSAGVGYGRMKYDIYTCEKCGDMLKKGKNDNYFGPTKLGISFVYVIK